MTASSMISVRRSAAALAVLFASLTIAPAAMASVIAPPDRADGLGGANPTTHSVTAMPQTPANARAFHAHELLDARLAQNQPTGVRVAFTPPPDRVDGLGSGRFTTVATPVSAPAATTSSSFDWTAAVLGAVAGLGIALVAMAGWLTRSRRNVALPSS